LERFNYAAKLKISEEKADKKCGGVSEAKTLAFIPQEIEIL
jgi:hypothetical protein